MPAKKHSEFAAFHTDLLAWYATHGRHHLPWRTTDNPYHIWVSEVMLQQTQVQTVLERFYFPFLEKFPTVEALANASEEAVMKAWEGLGYYRRARHLHQAARVVVSSQSSVVRKDPLTPDDSRLTTSRTQRPLEGGLTPPCGDAASPAASGSPSATHDPDDWRLTTLLSLPGIGKNTAHAILAFGFRQPVAILEANVKRIVARIFALETPSDKALWAAAERLMGVESPVVSRQSSAAIPHATPTEALDGLRLPPRGGVGVSSLEGRLTPPCGDAASPAASGSPSATQTPLTTDDSELTTIPDPFDYNQAMMDLGSMICTPKTPRCGECPAVSICAGKGDPTRYPAPKAKKQVPTREVTIFVREDANGRLFLEPREAALLGGLYGFPQSLVVSRESSVNPFLTTHDSRLTTHLGTVTHTYSHFKLLGHVLHETLPEKMNAPHWHSREEIAHLPLSTVDHKILALLNKLAIKKRH